MSSDAECDGVRDCSDGSDEHGCIGMMLEHNNMHSVICESM